MTAARVEIKAWVESFSVRGSPIESVLATANFTVHDFLNVCGAQRIFFGASPQKRG